MFRGDPVAYGDWQPEVMGQFELTAHYILNTHYAFDGRSAEGELYFLTYHRTRPPERRDMLVGGRYLDRYERRRGRWAIVHRQIAWDFVRDAGPDEAALRFLSSLGDVGSGADDVSYDALPLLAKARGL
jgi:hypothetical protein